MTTLGRYRIDSLIASGSMAEVHAGTDTTLLRKVAIKLPHRHLWSDATARERFLREGRAIAGLSHEHIVHLYDLGESEDRLYLAMEYVEGLSLERWLEKTGPLPPLVVFALLWQILKGLCAAHAHGLLHRDIKPANLLLTPQGHLKIADFGLSRLMGASALSTTEAFIGTPRYAAPEVASGGMHTAKSDVFSAALVALEMLSGKPAILADDPHIALMALREGRFDNSHAIAPTAPPGMHRVLEAMLKLDADARLKAGEALAMLESYARDQRIHLSLSRVADYLQADPAQRLALQEKEKGELGALWLAEADALSASGQMATARKSRIIAAQLLGEPTANDLAPNQIKSAEKKVSATVQAKSGVTLSVTVGVISLALVLALVFALGLLKPKPTETPSRAPGASHPESVATPPPPTQITSPLPQPSPTSQPAPPQLAPTADPVSVRPIQDIRAPSTASPKKRSTATSAASVASAATSPMVLPAEPAVLRILTRPGLSDVFIDGRSHGKTPTAWIALSPGSHRIRLERQGWQPLEEDITLKPADSLEMRRELKPE